jgi:hypothetical protein
MNMTLTEKAAGEVKRSSPSNSRAARLESVSARPRRRRRCSGFNKLDLDPPINELDDLRAARRPVVIDKRIRCI